MENAIQLPSHLYCLLYEDKLTGLWVNHSLILDLVTSGKTEEDAWNAMKVVAKAHIERCLSTGYVEGLSRKADGGVWDQFATKVIAARGELRYTDKLRVDLPKHHSSQDLEMKGVQVEAVSAEIRAAS